MIRSGTVALARTISTFKPVWLIPSFALFLLQFVYPAVRLGIEQQMWTTSLSTRHDAVLSTYILDGVLGWAGLLAGLCVSSVMYRIALHTWRDETYTVRDLLTGFFRSNEFLQLSFGAAVLQEVSWFFVFNAFPKPYSVFVQLLLTWLAITPAIFVVPLIIDRGLSTPQALKASYEVVKRGPGQAFGLLLTAGFWSEIGAVLCLVGAIRTMPIYQLSVARAYLDCFEATPLA